MNRYGSLVAGLVLTFTAATVAQRVEERPTSRPTTVKQNTVAGVAVWGAAELNPSEVTPSIHTKRGDVPNAETLAADQERVLAMYNARGFLHAKVTVKQIPAKDGTGIVVVFHVVEGPAVRPESRKATRER